jgi:peptidoglycan/xylan/chitin deacetylase (PgdA/CDA1 family)
MNTVLFSFDIEEFDMPLEYKKSISFDDQIKISSEGTAIILDLLKESNIKATFFSTATFAVHSSSLIKRLCKDGHELASHGYFHSQFESDHLAKSKRKLEEISGHSVNGFRMPRMMPVDNDAIVKAGYLYNSSLNPVFIPGRYNNFFSPRSIFKEGDLIQLPASATPIFRIPLFWLSFHNFPLWFYKRICTQAMNADRYLNIYFHPWEFTDLTYSHYGFPGFVSKNSGILMINRFKSLLSWMKDQQFQFSTIDNFLQNNKK